MVLLLILLLLLLSFLSLFCCVVDGDVDDVRVCVCMYVCVCLYVCVCVRVSIIAKTCPKLQTDSGNVHGGPPTCSEPAVTGESLLRGDGIVEVSPHHLWPPHHQLALCLGSQLRSGVGIHHLSTAYYMNE